MGHVWRVGHEIGAPSPDHIPAEVGTQLQAQTPDGQTLAVMIADVNDEAVTLDANHPLAGRDLNFAVSIVGIS